MAKLKTTGPIDRTELIQRVIKLESQIARAPRDNTTVAALFKHSGLQVAYWRARQALASIDTYVGDPDNPSYDDLDRRKTASVESRKCADTAAEWMRRIEAARKLELGKELEALRKLIEDQHKTAGEFRDIETS